MAAGVISAHQGVLLARTRGGTPVYTLGWETPVEISTVGDSIVETTGTLVEAVNCGAVAGRTVNGVPFAGSLTRDGFSEGGYVSATLYANGGVGADFALLLQSFAYFATDGTPRPLTLTGLTAGRTHLVQLFLSDDRASSVGRTYRWDLESYRSGTMTCPQSLAFICRFVASDTTQVISMTYSGGAILNGFQSRLLP